MRREKQEPYLQRDTVAFARAKPTASARLSPDAPNATHWRTKRKYSGPAARDGHNARKLAAPNLGAANAPTTHARFRYPNFGWLAPTTRHRRCGPRRDLGLQHATSRRCTVIGCASRDAERPYRPPCQTIAGPLLPGTWQARERGTVTPPQLGSGRSRGNIRRHG